MFLLNWYRTYTNTDKLPVKQVVAPTMEHQDMMQKLLAVPVKTVVDECRICEDAIPASLLPQHHESCQLVRVLTLNWLDDKEAIWPLVS